MNVLKNRSGFSLIEMLVFLFIFMISGLTFYKAFQVATAYILESKNHIAATEIANEKMEIVRSLPYANIGTKKPDGSGGWIMGIPGGDILEHETVVKNTRTFYIHTLAKYQDDTFDGTAIAGTDVRPADYKEVRIQVSWDPNYSENKSAILVSRFVPPGVEAVATGGILSVNVQDNLGAPIDGAAVRLRNTSTGIDQTYNTVAGNVMFFEVPQDTNPNYQISVSKSGYFSVQTYPLYDSSVSGSFDPVNKNTAITDGNLWTSVITTDRVANLNIQTVDMFGNPVPNVQFSLEGGMFMGNENPTVTPLVPIYSYNETNLDSGGDGEIEITDPSGLSSGTYVFNATDIPAGYEFFKINSSTTKSNEFYLQPNSNLDANALFFNQSVDSLVVTINNSVDDLPVAGATVTVKDVGLTYELTVTTDYAGRAFFSNGTNPLINGMHEIIITSTGFLDKSENISINGLTKQTIELDAS